MAKTDIFTSSSSLSTIEEVTGIQAPVMEDFVAVPFGTVNHEHGERRQIQNLANNLKSSSGIERISFDGIDELDTEQGLNGEVVHALNTGDSRIRFVGNGWTFRVNNDGSRPSTDNTGDYIEVTFYGTGFNLLGRIDPNSTWTANLDGGADFVVLDDGSGSAPSDLSSVLNGQNVDANEIIPVTSGLTAGVHTIRIRRETDQLFLTGCEIINENAAITQQPGADFDGRVEALAGTSFPIKPTNTTITSVNSRTGVSEAFTGTTGARVLNYITSGGQFKQSFDIADEAPGFIASTQTYSIILNNGGSSSVTIPASVSSLQVFAYGTGGAGGGGAATNSGNRVSGGGGGGGGLAIAAFTRDSGNTAAATFAITIPTAPTGGTGVVGAVGTAGNVIVTSGGTAVVTANGGGAGQSAPNVSVSGGTTSGGGATIGSLANWTTGSIATGTGGDGTAGINGNNGGSGGNVAGFGNSPLVNDEGQGFAGSTGNGFNGMVPGGGGSGGGSSTSSINPGAESSGGNGTTGRVYLEITATAGLAFGDFNVTDTEFTANPVEGGDAGSATAKFGNQAFDTNRLNQEVIRRINFREFGANTQFATLGTSDADNAFTLDDGTTTLVARDAASVTANGLTGLSADTNGAITITFVGTGLDVVNNRTGPLGAHTVSVDGFSIGTLPTTQPIGVIPIVSGLSYGTHTVAFLPTGAPRISIVDFIIYGPKKPEIPELDEGSLELSDYNIMADYVPTTVRGDGVEDFQPSKGTIVKPPLREVLYAGTISAAGRTSDALFLDGIGFNGANSSLEYTFYGTDIDIVARTGSGNFTVTVMLDGAAYTGAATVVTNTTTPSTWTPSTSTWQQGNEGFREVLQINNLDLGVHTIRITGDGNFVLSALFFHSPIHINDSNLKVGSEGLNNLTIDPVVEEDEAVVQNLGEAKAWVNYSASNTTIQSSHNIAAIVTIGGDVARPQIHFDKPFKDNTYIVNGVAEPTGTPTAAENFVVDRRSALGAGKTAGYCTLAGGTFNFLVTFFGELIDE